MSVKLLKEFSLLEQYQYVRDGPLENLWGQGASEVQKKKFAQGKIKRKKILARQLTLKNIHAMA